MFENTQGVTELRMCGRTHLYCPMGDDWYTLNVEMVAEGPETIPDYIDVTKRLEEMDGDSLIIEDAAHILAGFVRQQVGRASKVEVTATVDDARHVPVVVTVRG